MLVASGVTKVPSAEADIVFAETFPGALEPCRMQTSFVALYKGYSRTLPVGINPVDRATFLDILERAFKTSTTGPLKNADIETRESHGYFYFTVRINPALMPYWWRE